MRNAHCQALPYIYWIRNLRVKLSNLVFNKFLGNCDTCSNLRIAVLFYSTFSIDYHVIWLIEYGKDSLLNQILLRPLNLLLGLSVHFLVKSSFGQKLSQFNQHPLPSISDHLHYMIRLLILHRPPPDVWSPWPVFCKNCVRSSLPGTPFTPDVSS